MARMLKVEEVALSVGVSTKTINNWYAFKRACPDNEYASLLPDFQQEHPRATRLWNVDDVWRLIDFKSRMVIGRNGEMGIITQKYIKKEKTNET